MNSDEVLESLPSRIEDLRSRIKDKQRLYWLARMEKENSIPLTPEELHLFPEKAEQQRLLNERFTQTERELSDLFQELHKCLLATCWACDGTGRVSPHDAHGRCSVCRGTGRLGSQLMNNRVEVIRSGRDVSGELADAAAERHPRGMTEEEWVAQMRADAAAQCGPRYDYSGIFGYYPDVDDWWREQK